jgi:hypothetical protein
MRGCVVIACRVVVELVGYKVTEMEVVITGNELARLDDSLCPVRPHLPVNGLVYNISIVGVMILHCVRQNKTGGASTYMKHVYGSPNHVKHLCNFLELFQTK